MVHSHLYDFSNNVPYQLFWELDRSSVNSMLSVVQRPIGSGSEEGISIELLSGVDKVILLEVQRYLTP